MAGSKVSGVGRFAKRTDLPSTPGIGRVGDPTDLQYGDVGKLEAAQKIAPIASKSARASGRQMQGSVPERRGLPSWMFEMESANPQEPVTTGLPMGAGAGPEALDAAQPPDDVREMVLEYLASTFQNPTAVRHLADLRAERSATQPPMALPAGPSLPTTPEAQPSK